MSKSSVIYWFSGTGNSLYAAKKLSDELGNTTLVQITDEPPISAINGESERIGFVFPAYYWNLPRAVRAFIEKLNIKPDIYIFAVVTMGGIGHGAIKALSMLLKSKGLQLNYGKGLKMPDNYILLYNPTAPDKSQAILDKNDQTINELAADIKTETQSVKSLPFCFNSMYKNIESLDAKFTVKDVCTNCGLCEKICPVKNIKMDNDKPKWQHHCEHCVACISWCPAKAIEYGSRTQSRNRYYNPRVNASELIRSDKE